MEAALADALFFFEINKQRTAARTPSPSFPLIQLKAPTKLQSGSVQMSQAATWLRTDVKSGSVQMSYRSKRETGPKNDNVWKLPATGKMKAGGENGFARSVGEQLSRGPKTGRRTECKLLEDVDIDIGQRNSPLICLSSADKQTKDPGKKKGKIAPP